MNILFFESVKSVESTLKGTADHLVSGALPTSHGIEQLIDAGVKVGGSILKAVLIFIIGRFIISLLNKLLVRMLSKRDIDVSIKTFIRSLVSILLTILLIISVVGALGVETTSFAALLASAGVAVGMALSGNLQNFAGGLIILLFKPYRVGDYVEGQGTAGTIKEIQIFHTIIITLDNKIVYVPNGAMSSGVVTNFSKMDTRRVEWTVGVEYGEDVEKVEHAIRKVIAANSKILAAPEAFIALSKLSASSVDFVIRVWVKSEDYWDVYFAMNQQIYTTFNAEGINFPFPQLTIHKAE